MDGADYDHYYAIPATVSTKAGTVYTLALFYERTSIVDLLLREAPKYLSIWIVSLISILFISRFLLRKAFEPTEQILQSQKICCRCFTRIKITAGCYHGKC